MAVHKASRSDSKGCGTCKARGSLEERPATTAIDGSTTITSTSNGITNTSEDNLERFSARLRASHGSTTTATITSTSGITTPSNCINDRGSDGDGNGDSDGNSHTGGPGSGGSL
ncbi:hypothetical protein K490DRAFT_65906 [Saccharata proteae CBS 121410]|uniref:Uncharacterized protein n=1 Tax=Saccharata proteae CBS 121410 TaxID=1314787 RepID=A0A9P4HUE8_9PEZI|nr:hypothetical protein K490DRAFT_65906 [Saccharata proteae CBS 121410]